RWAGRNDGMMERWKMTITAIMVIPTFRRSIVSSQYSGCVRIARTRSSKSWDSGVTLPSVSVCTFQAASSFSAVASSYVRCSTCPVALLLALSSAFLSTSGKCWAFRTASYCCLVTVRSMGESRRPPESPATQSVHATHRGLSDGLSRPCATRHQRRSCEGDGYVRRVDRAAQRPQDALLCGYRRHARGARARSIEESTRQGRTQGERHRLHHLLHLHARSFRARQWRVPTRRARPH